MSNNTQLTSRQQARVWGEIYGKLCGQFPDLAEKRSVEEAAQAPITAIIFEIARRIPQADYMPVSEYISARLQDLNMQAPIEISNELKDEFSAGYKFAKNPPTARELIHASWLNQVQIAAALGVNASTVQRWYQGKTAKISDADLYALEKLTWRDRSNINKKE